MAHHVAFCSKVQVHLYNPDPTEHVVAKDPKSEALVALAIKLQEKTSAIMEIHKLALEDPEIQEKEQQQLARYEQLHEELDDTLNQLQHLVKSKYPSVDRIERLQEQLLQAHTTVIDHISLLSSKQIAFQGLNLAKTRFEIHKHYKEAVHPKFSNLTKEDYLAYLVKYQKDFEKGQKLKSSLMELKPLDESSYKLQTKALDELESYLVLLGRIKEAVDFQKDIAFMVEKKYTISYLPIGLLHEVEPKQPGTKRYRIAGFFGK
jgi:hypothetical protein